jgi:hypothetical protein
MQTKLARFVLWICSKFSRTEIEHIVSELVKILSDKNAPIKPKDSFQQEYPNYRKFQVDPKTPLTTKPGKKK